MFQGGGGQRRTRAANGTILARATQPGPSNSSNCGGGEKGRELEDEGGPQAHHKTKRTQPARRTHPDTAHGQNGRTTMRIHKTQEAKPVQTCSRILNLTSQSKLYTRNKNISRKWIRVRAHTPCCCSESRRTTEAGRRRSTRATNSARASAAAKRRRQRRLRWRRRALRERNRPWLPTTMMMTTKMMTTTTTTTTTSMPRTSKTSQWYAVAACRHQRCPKPMRDRDASDPRGPHATP